MHLQPQSAVFSKKALNFLSPDQSLELRIQRKKKKKTDRQLLYVSDCCGLSCGACISGAEWALAGIQATRILVLIFLVNLG